MNILNVSRRWQIVRRINLTFPLKRTITEEKVHNADQVHAENTDQYVTHRYPEE